MSQVLAWFSISMLIYREIYIKKILSVFVWTEWACGVGLPCLHINGDFQSRPSPYGLCFQLSVRYIVEEGVFVFL